MNTERFYSGKTFSQYLEQMDPANRDGFVASYQAASLTEEQVGLANLIQKKVYVFAVSEGWCGDCRINLPVLARLSEASPLVLFRCHGKEASLDLDIGKIPTFIFYNEAFEETGRWIERPSSVAAGLATEDQEARRSLRRAYNAGQYHAETFSELVMLARG